MATFICKECQKETDNKDMLLMFTCEKCSIPILEEVFSYVASSQAGRKIEMKCKQ